MGKRIAIGVLAGALVGLQWGLVETGMLRLGGIPIAARQAAETLILFALLGLAIAPAGIALALLARGNLRSGAASLPAAVTALVFVGLFVNVRWLPAFFAPLSSAADVLLVLGAALAVAKFAARPWGVRGDWALAAAILALNAAGFAWTAPPRAHATPAVAPVANAERRPDLFVILVDTLRADHLGTYGYERPTSPRIDALAAGGIVMERAFSSSNWTRPAVASLLTSTMPSRHQVITLDRAVPDELPLLAEALHAGGYQTGFFTVGTNVEESDGYGRGADHFFSVGARHPAGRTVFVLRFLVPFLPWVVEHFPWTPPDPDSQADPERITKAALEWMRDVDRERPVFAYIHYLGPHSPYRPPARFDRFSVMPHPLHLENPPEQWTGRDALSEEERCQMIDLYDGEVLWNDAAIGDVLDGLRAAGRLDHAVVVLLADHGEAFGLNGVWGHNAGLFRSIVRVPMIFWASDSIALAAQTRLSIPASLIDVAPTLLDFAQLPIPDGFDGSTLLAWLRKGGDGDRAIFVENPLNDELGVRTRDWSYFQGRTADGFGHWLYAASDADQTENLIDQRPDLAQDLRTLAEQRQSVDLARGARAASIELDADRRKQLEALGYLKP